MPELLDPKNDFVFRKLFVNCPDLLADLINAVRSHEAPIAVVEVLDPHNEPDNLSGKFIVLDVLVRDVEGRLFNIEMQVRGVAEWMERSLYYLAKAYAGQLKRAEHYVTLKPVIGINLLDFELFEGAQAHWHFQLRDRCQPAVVLDILQLHVLELRKLDRQREQLSGTLADWIAYFKHWREDTIMSEIRHPPVQKALDELKHLSQDEETWWQALARERALLDEASYLSSARREGLAEGRREGQREGRMQGRSAMLTQLLTQKFGELPVAVQRRLHHADEAELDIWAKRILVVDSLDEIFR